MSTIEEIISTNFLLEDLKDQQKLWPVVDKRWLLSKNHNACVTSGDIKCSSIVVGIAEAVNFVATQILFIISWRFRGTEEVVYQYAFHGLMKICFPKKYTEEDILKFDHKITYVDYFKAKSELIACLSAKEQAYWFVKECCFNTIFKIIAAAIILKSPIPGPLGLVSLHRCAALMISVAVIGEPFHQCVDWVDHKWHVMIYHLAKKNHAQLT
jgi:hypothetical protein